MTSRTRTSHAFHSRPISVALASLAPLLLALVAPFGAAAGEDARAPDLGECDQLRVEEGNKVSSYLFGVGTQNYRWNGAAWDFVAPEAVLFANDGDHGVVGTHFAGPTWQSRSGSQVVGVVIDRCSPDPDSIPWLLLQSVPDLTGGPGIFNRVTFIQRLNTWGGKAPSFPGNFVGQVVKVPYTADYVFYRKSH